MKQEYDIAIIGSGIAGSMLAAILAKEGVNTIVIDGGTHPRFAVGESMVPESAVLLNIMAERFDIPELAYPASLDKIIENIGTSAAGIKLAFSFAWNKYACEHDPAHVVSTPVIAPEAHLFRQDIDAYYVALASRLGANFVQQTRIEDIIEKQESVNLKLSDGRNIKSKYLVDAAGFRSPVAEKFGMRKDSRQMQTNTRSMFTHMVGVELYESVVAKQECHRSPTHLAQSTLHHLFKGGWLWIIPFNNHPYSTNQLCSVGLQLDIDEHGQAGDPEKEFEKLLSDYPTIAKHFENASRVREWTTAPRINYTSTISTGSRYCLLGHAVGFVDPLFSRGLVNTFESINRVAPRLIENVRNDEWHKGFLDNYDKYSREVVRINDRLVANSYTAFDSFELWNAWFRIWISGSYIGVLRLRKIFYDYKINRDESELDRAFESSSFPGHLSIESSVYEMLFDDACSTMEKYKNGEMDELAAIASLQKLLNDAREHLPMAFFDFDNRFLSRPSQEFADSLLSWANSAPNGLKNLLGRPAAASKFKFLDEYRYGDRLVMNKIADEDLLNI